MAQPWLTSDDLIESVKRKISFPISQATFSEDDILKFANEEMAISQIPSILSFHEEYFVSTVTVALEADKSRYAMPERAIGSKLRDLFWSDESGNLFEMTRVSSDDRAYYQRNLGSNEAIHKFYIEGNDVVLTPNVGSAPTGSLVFVYYMRPNQLVTNDKAAIISTFSKTITLTNASIAANDTITIGSEVFTAVAGAPGTDEFQIGATAVITATNLVNAITTNGVVSASNGSPATNIVTLTYNTLSTEVETDNSTGFAIQSTQGIVFGEIPSTIVSGSVVDFLQTKPGHRIRAIDITIPSNAITGTTINFTSSDVPTDLVVGDYICLINECIIPQIPSDLHNGLAERTCARILAALGDQAGLAASNQKIAEIEVRQGSLIDNRTEGAPQKISGRHSLLNYQKIGSRRRF